VVRPAPFDAAVRGLVPDLLGYFGRRLDAPDDAADALGETLLVLWRRRSRVPDDEEALRQYAFGIARNVLASARRGRLRRRALADRVAEELAVALPESTREPDPELGAALGALTERDRELVLLVAWEGFGVAEAGAVLGLRADAARQRYSRARARLRELLTASLSIHATETRGGRVGTGSSRAQG
jgi:RNA polymerase sigma-70 factor (ECF subfamily)